MPCVRERGGNAQRVAIRGECRLSRRSSNQRNIHTKEHPPSAPRPEDRCSVLIVTLDIDSRVFLVPYYIYPHGSEGRNNSGTTTDTSRNPVHLSEQGNGSSSTLRPGSAESSTGSSSSATSVLKKSEKKSKQTRSIMTSIMSQGRFALDTSPVSDCEDFDAAASSMLINNNPKEEKQVKRSSRKKRKKKGKPSKRSAHKNLSGKSGTPCEGDICHSSNSETSLNNHSSSAGEFISQNMYTSNNSMKSCPPTSEIMCSTSSENTSLPHSNQNGICETFSCSDDQRSSSSEPNSFPGNLKVDTFAKDKYRCNSSEDEWPSISTGSSISAQTITVNDCDSSELSSCCFTNSLNEGPQCNSEASSSDEFHVVVYRKRGRQGRKASGNSNGFDLFSGANLHDWPALKDHNIGAKSSNLNSHHVDISSKVSEQREKSVKAKICKHMESAKSASSLYSDVKVIETAETCIAGVSEDNQMQEAEISLRNTNHQQIDSQLNSRSSTIFRNVGPLQDTQIDPEEEYLQGEICSATSYTSEQVAQNDIESLQIKSDFSAETQTMVHCSGSIADGKDSEKIAVETQRLNHFVPEVDELSPKFGSEPSVMEKPSGSLNVKTQSFAGFESDLYIIMQAVVESAKLLNASETIQLITGSTLAEFERFLHSASPKLGQTDWRQQVPHLSLRSLWQWYEKPGSFGLEVKVEGCNNPKSSVDGCSHFRTYFVPYLSAVQLFGGSKDPLCIGDDASNNEVTEFCEEDKTSKSSSYLDSIPRFSIPLLRPGEEVVPFNKDEVNYKPVSKSYLADVELLFEYFEAELPQKRKTLLEKIEELVAGNTLRNCQIFGDPSMLESLNLHDLHPASWFSVAWYPIYRIPDGNFRAAFLTYHSLGHSVPSSNVIGDTSQIVFPVVGMQSYNAKGECWFEQNSFSPDLEAMIPNPAKILKERLRSLEQAAFVMARATVQKGDQISVNRQSDYEFFLSHRW